MTTKTAVAHTPGPWSVESGATRPNDQGGFSVVNEANHIICGRMGWPSRAGESLANARLIAAAPELLAALRKVNDMACYASEENTDAREETLLMVGETVRAAIAKAEGES